MHSPSAPVFAPDISRAWDAVRQCPRYAATPLRRHVESGSQPLWIKDETARMGLGSFKALGGIHAAGQLILGHRRRNTGTQLDLAELVGGRVPAAAALTLVCASAGNHGLAVAAGARLFGAAARIHLPASAPMSFERRLRAFGAMVVRADADYDAVCEIAHADAADAGAIWLPDWSPDDSSPAPALVMEGYLILAEELCAEFSRYREWPTQVYVQAGVGSFAAAIAHHIRAVWPVSPEIIVVEPDRSPCVAAALGQTPPLTATEPSAMQRLDCKRAARLAVRTLAEARVRCASVTEAQARDAIAMLQGLGIATTPSGAAGAAALPGRHLTQSALVIITEGDFDPPVQGAAP